MVSHQRNMVWYLLDFISMFLHLAKQPGAVRRALDDAGLDISRDIDGIAFTRGPGELPKSNCAIVMVFV